MTQRPKEEEVVRQNCKSLRLPPNTKPGDRLPVDSRESRGEGCPCHAASQIDDRHVAEEEIYAELKRDTLVRRLVSMPTPTAGRYQRRGRRRRRRLNVVFYAVLMFMSTPSVSAV